MVLVLVVGVPLGALVGLLALGVFAAMAAIVIAAVDDPSDAATIVGDNLLIPDFGRPSAGSAAGYSESR